MVTLAMSLLFKIKHYEDQRQGQGDDELETFPGGLRLEAVST